MVERRIPRVQEIILPVLREALPGVLVTSWIPDVDRRSYPLVNIRKVGGIPVDMDVLDRQTIGTTGTTPRLCSMVSRTVQRPWPFLPRTIITVLSGRKSVAPS